MFRPSAIQRSDDLVGIATPMVCFFFPFSSLLPPVLSWPQAVSRRAQQAVTAAAVVAARAFVMFLPGNPVVGAMGGAAGSSSLSRQGTIVSAHTRVIQDGGYAFSASTPDRDPAGSR